MADQNTPKENEEQQAQDAAPEKKKGGLPMPVILLVVLLAQVAISYLLITKVLFKIDSQTPPEESALVSQEKKEAMGSVYLVPELVVNPYGAGGSPRYIKCGFGIEVDTEDAYAEIETRQPQVLDTLIRVLTSKGLDDLDTPQEKNLLRMEIQENLNDYLIAGEVTHVYLTDFVIQ